MGRGSNKLKGILAVAVLGTSLFTPVANVSYAAADDFELTVMHTNDTHAHLDNVARRITAINQVRSEVANSILLDAGDVFSGTLFFNKYEGQADLEFMNMIGYDVMVPGNHEFDKGPAVLAEFVKNADFPIVSANIDYSNEQVLAELVAEEKITPTVVLDVNGEKVGVLGLTTVETAFLANPGENITFNDEVESAKAAVQSLEEEGINKIIALTHLGYSKDLKVAEMVEGIDVIVGGHTHTKLEEPVVVGAEDGVPTIIVQANEYGKFLGKLNVTFNADGVLTEWAGQLINVNAKDEAGNYIIADDETAKALYEEKKAPIEELKAEVVGSSNVFLNGERSFVRQGETNLGNFIADGILAAAQKALPETTLAIQNGGGIRASIDAGEISLGDVLTTMPFGNMLVTLELTGAEVIEALENGVSKVEEKQGRFPHVAGMKFTFDPTLPAGERVLEVLVKTDEGFEPINVEQSYTLATNAYIADGGDDYQVFKKAKDEGRITELYLPDYEVFNGYLQEVGTVEAVFEGRIMQKVHDVASKSTVYEAVNEIVARSIITLDNGQFYPTQAVTRGEAAQWLTTALNLQVPEKLTVFSDVEETHAMAGAIAAVKAAGIFNGYDDGTFGADDTLTREQMATVLVRAFEFAATEKAVQITDKEAISPSHVANVEILLQNGISTGKDDGSFAPHETVTRSMFALFLQRSLHN
ncbi:5'-nucleotidase C-terminal domain-containing protein [Bacillus salinus]|uniref:5'-nucleotidase C-terminal domain-containing protein n=1 Tax=Bacillus sp. HMF5848 TaxID=2495421 RepID=UPI00163B0786|nr:5'-nucleotidase C-terminal domain-containing protein [Bacillus sp. HMF5848]